jgi:hypothetical protein
MTKICSKCKVEKQLTDFTKRYDRAIGVRPHCKECQRKIDAKKRTTDKGKSKYRNSSWKKQGINITYEEYKVKYEAVKGCCEICKTHLPSLCVDHNHSTGEIRGLLCTACNLGIEKFKETTSIITNAIYYLDKYGAKYE